MRKITNNAVNAFMSARPNNGNYSESNTKVSAADNDVYMYLHGNIIAIRNFDTGIIRVSNAGWFSNTTKERLNGLPNVRIQQKQGKWYLNGTEWNGDLTEVK